MFESAGLFGDKTVIEAAQDMFAKFTQGDKSAIHPNIRESVFAINLVYGGEKEVSKAASYSHSFAKKLKSTM